MHLTASLFLLTYNVSLWPACGVVTPGFCPWPHLFHLLMASLIILRCQGLDSVLFYTETTLTWEVNFCLLGDTAEINHSRIGCGFFSSWNLERTLGFLPLHSCGFLLCPRRCLRSLGDQHVFSPSQTKLISRVSMLSYSLASWWNPHFSDASDAYRRAKARSRPLEAPLFSYPEVSFIAFQAAMGFQSPCSPALRQLGCCVFRTEDVGHWGHWKVPRFHTGAV